MSARMGLLVVTGMLVAAEAALLGADGWEVLEVVLGVGALAVLLALHVLMVFQQQRVGAALRVSEAKYRFMAENMKDVLWQMTPQLVFTYVSPSNRWTFGYLPEDVVGRPLWELLTPASSAQLRARLAQRRPGPEGRLGTATFELEQLAKDGHICLTEVVSNPIYDAAGTLTGFQGVTRDITERKRAEQVIAQQAQEIRALNADLEQRVVRRTAELEAANRELEAFSSAVSHDLRAPLRAVTGFARALEEDCAAPLSPTCRGHLERIHVNCRRMGQLIDELLKLARLSRAELAVQEVDLVVLAQELAVELRAQHAGREVDLVLPATLPAQGDPLLLRVVLGNLLGNAWKFTAKHPRARIEVGSREEEGQRVYFVKDDGAGFDPVHAPRLFGAFQRLHRAEEFEGVGIGLASVQRIVRRHGGRAWAQGAPEQGATFSFTLAPERPR